MVLLRLIGSNQREREVVAYHVGECCWMQALNRVALLGCSISLSRSRSRSQAAQRGGI
jgi:hypothetical protein